MRIKNCLVATVLTIAAFALFVPISNSSAADDNYSISSGNQNSTIKTPDIDRSQKPEKKEAPVKTDTNYDVKKSNDEHIPATEKAAADAAEQYKK